LTYRHRQTGSDKLVGKYVRVSEVRVKGVLMLVKLVDKQLKTF
jgi:transcription elongation factor